ncbi:MAG: hypothetical protein Kow0069_39270 [Promethearchaeota archaeon]
MESSDGAAPPPGAEVASPGGKRRKVDVLDSPGGARAVVSGAYNMIFSLVASSVLWVMMVVGSGSDVVAYYSVGSATLGIVGIASTGFSQSYVARVKEALVSGDRERAVEVASVFARFLFYYGLLTGTLALALGVVLVEPFELFKWTFLYGAPVFFLNFCVRDVMIFSLQVANRYDLAGLLGATWGLLNVTMGVAWVVLGLPAHQFPLVGTASNFVVFPLAYGFFRRHAPFTLRELFSAAGLKSPLRNRVLSDAGLTTLSNMESFQLVSNVNVVTNSLALAVFFPSLRLVGTRLVGILNIYVQVKCALLYFSSPLNVEVAEAHAKGDAGAVADVVNHSGRFAFLVGFGIIAGFVGLSPVILTKLHGAFFLAPNSGAFDDHLFRASLAVVGLMMLGQAGFGVACLFANALVGTGHAKASAKVFVAALAASAFFTPFSVGAVGLGILGIGASTAVVGVAAGVAMVAATKRSLGVATNFRLKNLSPLLAFNFLFLGLFPYGAATGSFGGDLALALAVVVAAYLPGLSFMGVFRDEGDWALLRDVYVAFGLGRVADRLVSFSRRVHAANPLHRQRGSGGRVSQAG